MLTSDDEMIRAVARKMAESIIAHCDKLASSKPGPAEQGEEAAYRKGGDAAHRVATDALRRALDGDPDVLAWDMEFHSLLSRVRQLATWHRCEAGT